VRGCEGTLGAVNDVDGERAVRFSALERVASLQPTTLACMHGSAWTGDGAGLIRELAATLEVGESLAADLA
jgi:hypothetical protein